MSSETPLRYLDWVASRRARVDELSDGRIGYVHLPNTAFAGNRELRKYFYPQAHREALILDDRYNGGGFHPRSNDRAVEPHPALHLGRRGIVPFTTPGYFHDGPKAVLINAYAASRWATPSPTTSARPGSVR